MFKMMAFKHMHAAGYATDQRLCRSRSMEQMT